jgi:transposase-like protein
VYKVNKRGHIGQSQAIHRYVFWVPDLNCQLKRRKNVPTNETFSISTQRYGCHPFTATLSPSVMAGSRFTHAFPLPASATTYVTYVAPSLPAWSSMRKRCCCINGIIIKTASSPERRVRGPRVGCASRSPCTEDSDFIISKWASYFSCRSLICNPLMSLRSHCSKVASLAQRLKAIGVRAALHCRTGMAANSEYRLACASGELIV